MRTILDDTGGRAVGPVIQLKGSVLGLRLAIVEKVIERAPPRRKVWETIEEPRLVVFGNYRLGFEIAPERSGSRVRVFIFYDWPRTSLGRILGPLGTHAYARWCLTRVSAEAHEAAKVPASSL